MVTPLHSNHTHTTSHDEPLSLGTPCPASCMHEVVSADTRLAGMPSTCVNDAWRPHVQTKHHSMTHEASADHAERIALATHDSG